MLDGLRLNSLSVATVLTVYGIETTRIRPRRSSNPQLQQPLPFTVLKQESFHITCVTITKSCNSAYRLRYWNHIVCTSLP